MRTGFTQAREDLFDDRQGRPFVTSSGASSTPSSAAGTAVNDSFNRLVRSIAEGRKDCCAPTLCPTCQDDGGHLPAAVRARFDELVEAILSEPSHLIVTLDGLVDDQGSLLVFSGTTGDGDEVLVGVDARPAALLLDSLATLGPDVVVEVEAWQVLRRHEKGRDCARTDEVLDNYRSRAVRAETTLASLGLTSEDVEAARSNVAEVAAPSWHSRGNSGSHGRHWRS